MTRHICIHGHFYQPPRENPWLETVERQDSAHPHHDWNQRVTAECYAPNAASRLFDEDSRITDIVSNYSRMSFNFGPTLLSWMEENTRFTYGAILEADRASRERFDGHGSAMAQAYGHMIMPLASPRDKRTQVRWGIKDFQKRFERDPEGMWLPETAVDLDTLEALAEHGIAFTVLAPRQAAAVRPLNGDDATAHEGEDAEGAGDASWQDVSGGHVDPSRPYLVNLPSGRTIAVFFYDGPISRAVAFEELARNGERLAERLLGIHGEDADEPRLVHIATDGETFGHHHVYGELALSYALAKLEEEEGVEVTNYAHFLERHAPRWEAKIIEGSSWSCVHGVERWRSDCGCSTGAPASWNQAWRAPLRKALDGLREELDPRFEEAAGELLADPWDARDQYIRVVLDRSPGNVESFLSEHAAGELGDAEKVRALKLLELQRHAMLMYTSCGWFFADISGIETVQVLRYAGRVIQLAEDLFGESVESGFLSELEHARSNIQAKQNGRVLYEKEVRPERVDLPEVAAHYVLRSLFKSYEGDEAEVHCYRVSDRDESTAEADRSRVLAGWAHFRSVVTHESAHLSYAAVYTGDHHVIGGVRGFQGTRSARAARQQLEEAFERGELAKMVRVLDQEYHVSIDSLRALFPDEQEEVLEQIMESSVREAEVVLEDLYEKSASLMRFAAELGVPPPGVFQTAARSVLNRRMDATLRRDPPDLDHMAALCAEVEERGVHLEHDELHHAVGKALARLADHMAEEPDQLERLENLKRGVELMGSLDFKADLWGAQNTFFRVLRNGYGARVAAAEEGDAQARRWIDLFRQTGEMLSVAVT
ncbi:MAG: DUF3536 domain-containing protein [Gemmatimonadota bacterium]|nr:DUF3536 domain-containing protein [Gemmatimonadota bacterium]